MKSFTPSRPSTPQEVSSQGVSNPVPVTAKALVPAKVTSNVPDDRSEDILNDSPEDTQVRPAKRAKTWGHEHFACMTGGNDQKKAENPNADVVERLQEMADYYERTGDHWRSLSFRKGVSTLKKQTKRITTKEEARELPFVGESIAEAIEKIVQTGRLQRLEATKDDPLNQVLELFMGIYGVGLSQATKWVSIGYRTLDDIRTKAQLSENQRVGLDHYDDLQQRIPRAEVEMHGEIFKKCMACIDPLFEVTIGGSYRRGSQTSGDIDLIITEPHAQLPKIRTVILESVVPALFESGFLKAELARTSSVSGSKWHGCSALPGPNSLWRRIDFLLVPWDEMGAALIYFTGNDIFNRSIVASISLRYIAYRRERVRGEGQERASGVAYGDRCDGN